jgi:hypothetical protein
MSYITHTIKKENRKTYEDMKVENLITTNSTEFHRIPQHVIKKKEKSSCQRRYPSFCPTFPHFSIKFHTIPQRFFPFFHETLVKQHHVQCNVFKNLKIPVFFVIFSRKKNIFFSEPRGSAGPDPSFGFLAFFS